MVHQIHKLLEQLKLIPGQNMEVQKLLLSFIGWNSMHLVWFPCISCMEFRPPWSDFHPLAWKSDSSIPAWCGSAGEACTGVTTNQRWWTKENEPHQEMEPQRMSGSPQFPSFEATSGPGRDGAGKASCWSRYLLQPSCTWFHLILPRRLRRHTPWSSSWRLVWKVKEGKSRVRRSTLCLFPEKKFSVSIA